MRLKLFTAIDPCNLICFVPSEFVRLKLFTAIDPCNLCLLSVIFVVQALLQQKADKLQMIDKQFHCDKSWLLSVLGDAGVKIVEDLILAALPTADNVKQLKDVVNAVQQIMAGRLFDFVVDSCRGRCKALLADLHRTIANKPPKENKQTDGFKAECYRRLSFFASVQVNRGTDKFRSLKYFMEHRQ